MYFQKNLVSSGLTDIRSAFEDGEITAQEWGDVLISTLDRVAAKLQESFVDSLFDGGGLLSTLLGGVATTAGSVGGGVTASAGNAPQVGRTAAALTAPATSTPSTLARTRSITADVGAVPQVSPAAARLAAPAPSTLARTQSVAVDVGVGIDDDGKLYAKVKNIAQNEGRQAAAQGIGIYRANQFHADVQAHLARPRVRGK
ncbi:hypothetical protein [Rhizobium sp. G21]|uniref:hypothetical protein n=1 Tax=Rhizobium sp. G21 TaxID=2758439 RepID=UPI001601C1CF|nr:hypothetical protein [Rhizobium sp. G21]MBB1247461.1 hypothetical protein [Rhizobium sp. G21]